MVATRTLTHHQLPERRPQKTNQLPPIHVFVRRFPQSVMPAGQHDDFMIQFVLLEFLDHLLRKLRQERHVILRINNERPARPARKLIEVHDRTDGAPHLPQILQIDGRGGTPRLTWARKSESFRLAEKNPGSSCRSSRSRYPRSWERAHKCPLTSCRPAQAACDDKGCRASACRHRPWCT